MISIWTDFKSTHDVHIGYDTIGILGKATITAKRCIGFDGVKTLLAGMLAFETMLQTKGSGDRGARNQEAFQGRVLREDAIRLEYIYEFIALYEHTFYIIHKTFKLVGIDSRILYVR